MVTSEGGCWEAVAVRAATAIIPCERRLATNRDHQRKDQTRIFQSSSRARRKLNFDVIFMVGWEAPSFLNPAVISQTTRLHNMEERTGSTSADEFIDRDFIERGSIEDSIWLLRAALLIDVRSLGRPSHSDTSGEDLSKAQIWCFVTNRRKLFCAMLPIVSDDVSRCAT